MANSDPLEPLLEDWGYWRGWGVEGLSSRGTSPIVAVNKLEKGFTDALDRGKGKERRDRINSMSVPRETKTAKPIIPDYNGHKRLSKIDQLLAQIYGLYQNILIRKYEDGWDVKEFCGENGWKPEYASDRIYKARRAARKILRENGYKV